MKLARTLFVCALSFLGLAACGPTKPAANAPDSLAARKSAATACELRGNALIAKSRAEGDKCEKTTFLLQEMVRTDENCLIYFGDAGVTVVDLCTEAQ